MHFALRFNLTGPGRFTRLPVYRQRGRYSHIPLTTISWGDTTLEHRANALSSRFRQSAATAYSAIAFATMRATHARRWRHHSWRFLGLNRLQATISFRQ